MLPPGHTGHSLLQDQTLADDALDHCGDQPMSEAIQMPVSRSRIGKAVNVLVMFLHISAQSIRGGKERNVIRGCELG